MRVKLRIGAKKKGDNQKGGDLKKVIDPSLPSLREGYTIYSRLQQTIRLASIILQVFSCQFISCNDYRFQLL
jgi:hypothetical protein